MFVSALQFGYFNNTYIMRFRVEYKIVTCLNYFCINKHLDSLLRSWNTDLCILHNNSMCTKLSRTMIDTD